MSRSRPSSLRRLGAAMLGSLLPRCGVATLGPLLRLSGVAMLGGLFRWTGVAMLGALLLSACGGDSSGPEESFPSELVGQWRANPQCLPQGCSFTVYDPTAPADSFNVASAFSISMVIQSSGHVILTVPGYGSGEGDARVSGSRLYIEGPEKTDTADYSISGGALHLDFRSHFDNFDVDGDGSADLTRARAVLLRGS